MRQEEIDQESSQKGDRTLAQILLSRLEPLLTLQKEHEKFQAKGAGYKLETGKHDLVKLIDRKGYTLDKMAPLMDRTSFIVLENRANQLGLSFMNPEHEY